MEILDDAIGQAGFLEGPAHLFRNGRGLGGRLEDDRVSGKQGGDQGVDEDQIRILSVFKFVISTLSHGLQKADRRIHSTQR